jgi:hypothetical protein
MSSAKSVPTDADRRVISPPNCFESALTIRAPRRLLVSESKLTGRHRTAMWLIGPIQSVTGMTETFIKERKHNLTGKVEQVTIDNLGRGDVDHAIEEGAVGEFFHRASTGSGCMKYDAIEAVPELLGDSGDARRH